MFIPRLLLALKRERRAASNLRERERERRLTRLRKDGVIKGRIHAKERWTYKGQKEADIYGVIALVWSQTIPTF